MAARQRHRIHLTHNEREFVLAERFIRALKNKMKKSMT